MMDAFDLASKLFGNSRAESRGDVSNSLDILTATGAGDSSDGAATVYLDADVTPADDYDGDDYAIGIPTSPNVIEGDGVLVGLTGSGPLKTPVVISNPGSGDRMQVQVDNAETLAQQAEAVATATGQHFWPDTDGVHVTEVTQGEWNDSAGTSYHSGANVLLNALGQLFRDGLNNILAIVSGTDPGVAIYDGEGNAADNIMALFSKALIRIGGRLLGTGTSTASVQFFQSDASQTDIKATHTVGSTTPPTGPDDVYGVNHGVQVTTTTDGSELPQLAGVSGWAQLDMSAEVNPDYWAGSASLRARVGDDDEFGDGTPQLGVLRQVAANGIETAEIYMAAPTLALHDNAQYKTGRVSMEQAIIALQQPYAMFTGSSGTTTASSGGWRITWFNTVYSHSANWSDYFSFSNGVITAKRNIQLEISGCINWTDSIAGNRGFGVFVDSSTVSSGSEYSAFQYFPNTVNTRKSVWLTGLVLSLDAGVQCAVGRFEQTKAVYVNGANFSRIELKVLGTF